MPQPAAIEELLKELKALRVEVLHLRRQLNALSEKIDQTVKPSGYLNTKQAAQFLGVCPRTVINYIKQGILPSTKIKGRRLIPLEALQKLKENPEETIAQAKAQKILQKIAGNIAD